MVDRDFLNCQNLWISVQCVLSLSHKNVNCEQKWKSSKFTQKERQDSWCALLFTFLQFLTNVSCIFDNEFLWTAIMA